MRRRRDDHRVELGPRRASPRSRETVGSPVYLAEHVEQVAGGVADADDLDVGMRVDHREVRQAHLARARPRATRISVRLLRSARAIAERSDRSVPRTARPTCSQVNSPRSARSARRTHRARASTGSSSRSSSGRADVGCRREVHGRAGSCDPAVVGVVVGDHRVARGHRLDERRVGAADRVTVQVGAAVEPQGRDDLGVVDRAEEDDLVARRRDARRRGTDRRRARSRRARRAACHGARREPCDDLERPSSPGSAGRSG